MLAKLTFLATMPFFFRSKADPSTPMAYPSLPMPVEEAGLPTTMTTPRQPVASAPLKIVPTEGVARSGIDGSRYVPFGGTVAATDAIFFFVEDWIDVCGETVETLEDIDAAYQDFRAERPWLPKVSPKKLSQTLTALGCRRMWEDHRRKGGNGRRLVVFEIRKPRRAQQQRRAAA